MQRRERRKRRRNGRPDAKPFSSSLFGARSALISIQSARAIVAFDFVTAKTTLCIMNANWIFNKFYVV